MTDDADTVLSLYQVEAPGLTRLARFLTGSVDAAEDVVQEAFVRLQSRMVEVQNPGGYLRTTVVNLCRDRVRRLQQRERFEPRCFERGSVSPEANEMIDVLLGLPYRQRAVLVMRYWGDWSEAEIAEALGCRPGTVKTLASRGLARLRRDVTHG